MRCRILCVFSQKTDEVGQGQSGGAVLCVPAQKRVAATIPCTYDETTNTIAFSSDKFSTYTIVYTDVAVKKPTGTILESNREQETPVSDKNETPKKESPATGDTAAVGLLSLLFAISGFAVATLLIFKKQNGCAKN